MPPARQLTSSANIKGEEKSHRLLVPRNPHARPQRTRVYERSPTTAVMRNQSEQRQAQSATREITIVNELGLHARPAAEFVRCASQFRSEIFLVRNEKRLSATSMIEVLMADMNQGQSAVLEAYGADAEVAVETLAELVRSFRD